MQPTALEARPPYVRFEQRAIENQTKSLAEGRYVADDIDFALITPPGSKDVIERIVTEWFENLAREVQNERYPAAWLKAYREAHAAWKEGQEIPINGYSIKNWTFLSPAQVKTYLAFRIFTVEDIVAANEETIGRMGMGARSVKQAAIDFLASAKDNGHMARELAALKAENSLLKTRNDSLEKQLADIKPELEAFLKLSGSKGVSKAL